MHCRRPCRNWQHRRYRSSTEILTACHTICTAHPIPSTSTRTETAGNTRICWEVRWNRKRLCYVLHHNNPRQMYHHSLDVSSQVSTSTKCNVISSSIATCHGTEIIPYFYSHNQNYWRFAEKIMQMTFPSAWNWFVQYLLNYISLEAATGFERCRISIYPPQNWFHEKWHYIKGTSTTTRFHNISKMVKFWEILGTRKTSPN